MARSPVPLCSAACAGLHAYRPQVDCGALCAAG